MNHITESTIDLMDYSRCIEIQRSFEENWFFRFLGQPEVWFQSVRANGDTKYAAWNSTGGGKVISIKKGKPFSGRLQGGGQRSQIFGNWEYGSGYPDHVGRGVQGRGFPFYFWPVVWAGNAVSNDDRYLHTASEYGLPTNDERPGGPVTKTAFVSNSTGNTYRILADNATAVQLIGQIKHHCVSLLNRSSAVPSIYPWTPSLPFPEQAIQYYRASSIALTLDGYNNTVALLPVGAPDVIPSLGINLSDPLLRCLNTTIGCTALLVTKEQPVGQLAILRHFFELSFLIVTISFVALAAACCVVLFLFRGICVSIRLVGKKPGHVGASHSLTPVVTKNPADKPPRVSAGPWQASSPSGPKARHLRANWSGAQRDGDSGYSRNWDTATRVGDDNELLLQKQGSGSQA